MNFQKPDAIISSTLHCIIAGFVTGTLASVTLILLVMLFSATAGAITMDDVTAADLIRVDDPAGVRQGTLLFRGDQDFSMASILKTDVQINITGMIARAVVKQHFRNPDTTWKEGVYVFPLPEDAAVDHLRMHIGQRVIEGQIQERQQARKQYEQAKREGKKASLVEQERPNIFTTSVANIGPHEEIVIEIEYQHIVQYDAGTFRLRFPMVVAPRYIPGRPVQPAETTVAEFAGNGWAVNTDQVPDAARITPPVLHPEKGNINPVALQVRLDAGFPLQHITSSYHNIDIKQEHEAGYKLVLDNTYADRDFELMWKPEPGAEPRAAFFNEQKNGEKYALIMMLPPERETGEVLSREVIYVIDTSGSMSGTSIVQARAALELALANLKPGDRFNIIQFNSFTEALFRFPQPVTHHSLRQARNYVRGLEAQGGTEMLPALQAALNQSSEQSAVRQVIFLTDGSIGNEDELFRVIQQQLGNSRLFTIGIGSAPNSHFMSRAASFGRGTYTYIGKVEEVQEKMQMLFNKLQHPVLTNLQIHWGDPSTIETWPQRIPDLYLGEPLLLTAKAASLPETLNISGMVSGKTWNSSMTLRGGMEQTGISVLWARKKIAALMDQLNSPAEQDEIRRMIINTALAHHLVSKFTSLVAIDVTPARVKEELLKSHSMPVNLPAGWEYEKVFGLLPQTATDAQLYLLRGILFLLAGLLIAIFSGRFARRHVCTA
jgi:Ca-activated chloride channel family protein